MAKARAVLSANSALAKKWKSPAGHCDIPIFNDTEGIWIGRSVPASAGARLPPEWVCAQLSTVSFISIFR